MASPDSWSGQHHFGAQKRDFATEIQELEQQMKQFCGCGEDERSSAAANEKSSKQADESETTETHPMVFLW